MKKVSSLILLTIIPDVYAQELTILGRPLSIVIFVPLLLILLSILLLFYLRLKIARKETKELLHKAGLIIISIHRYLKETRLWRIINKIKRLKLKKRIEEKKEELPTYEEIDYNAELDDIESKISKRSPEASLKALTQLSRKFFSYNFSLNYEFTYEELAEALIKKGKEISEYAAKLSTFRYSTAKITRNDISLIAKELRKIITKYWKRKKKTKTASVIEKIVEEDKKIIHGIEGFVKAVKIEDKKRQLSQLLTEEKILLASDFRRLRSTYKRILNIYLSLKPKERAEIYPKLVQFSEQLKTFPMLTKENKQQIEEFTKNLKDMQHIPQKRTMGNIIEEKYLDLTKVYGEKIRKEIGKGKKEEVEYLSKIKEAVKKEEKVITTKVAEELDKLHEEEQILARKLHKLIEKKKEPAVHMLIQRKTEAEIERLLKEGENVLKHNDIPKARIIYEKLKKLYTKLEWGERKKVDIKIINFYKEIIEKLNAKKKK